jgi:hypothetical protein
MHIAFILRSADAHWSLLRREIIRSASMFVAEGVTELAIWIALVAVGGVVGAGIRPFRPGRGR